MNQPPPPVDIYDSKPVFFAVSTLKLFVMGTATLGLYQLFWFKKNWEMVKERSDGHVSPFWRTFFAPFFCYSLFKEIKETAISKGGLAGFPAGILATVWISLTLLTMMSSQWLLVIALSSLVLLPVQNAVNSVNKVTAPDHNPNTRFSILNLIGIALGVSVALAMIALEAYIDSIIRSINP